MNDVLRRVRCIEAHGIFRVIEILEEVGTKMIQIPVREKFSQREEIFHAIVI